MRSAAVAAGAARLLHIPFERLGQRVVEDEAHLYGKSARRHKVQGRFREGSGKGCTPTEVPVPIREKCPPPQVKVAELRSQPCSRRTSGLLIPMPKAMVAQITCTSSVIHCRCTDLRCSGSMSAW